MTACVRTILALMLCAVAVPARAETPDLSALLAHRPAPGHWAEIPATSARSVLLPRDQAPLDGGVMGSDAAIDAYSGAAWDGGRFWYFHGGGHTDYSGNEVYRFDLERLAWERLTMPTALAPDPTDPPCPRQLATDTAGRPADPAAPRSTHTYDGMAVIDGILYVAGSYGYSYCPDNAVHRFDPATRRWSTVVADRQSPGEIKSAYDPVAKRWYLIGWTRLMALDVPGGRLHPVAELPWLGAGSAVLAPDRGELFLLAGSSLLAVDLSSGAVRSVIAQLPGYLNVAGGLVYRAGLLWLWSGDRRMHTIDPETGSVRDHTPEDGPPPQSHVYSRFFHLPAADIFVAYPRAAGNVWLYRPDGGDGRDPTFFSPARAAAEAAPGSVIEIPPGTYYEPMVITADGVTVRARTPGTVRFRRAVAESKATIVVKANGVTLEDLSIADVAVGGNGACVRFNERGRDLVIRRLDCADAEMGVLITGERGDTLIEDSRFDRIGRPGADLGHNIYSSCDHLGGCPERLVVRSSSFTGERNEGHYIKSRARRTVLEGNTLDGRGATYSRLIDIPQGGVIGITGNTLYHDRGGNSDAIGLALEIRDPRAPEHAENRAEIAGNRIVSSHPKGVLVTNRLGGPLHLHDNTQTGLRAWVQDTGGRGPARVEDAPPR